MAEKFLIDIVPAPTEVILALMRADHLEVGDFAVVVDQQLDGSANLIGHVLVRVVDEQRLRGSDLISLTGGFVILADVENRLYVSPLDGRYSVIIDILKRDGTRDESKPQKMDGRVVDTGRRIKRCPE